MLRHRDANIDLEQIAVLALHRRRDDRHVTAGDPVMEFFQPLGLFFSYRPNCFRGFGIPEGDIGGTCILCPFTKRCVRMTSDRLRLNRHGQKNLRGSALRRIDP